MAKSGHGRGKRAGHHQANNSSHQPQQHHKRGKRTRTTETNAPSAAFLAALEAQRAKQTAEDQQTEAVAAGAPTNTVLPHAQQSAPTSESKPSSLPGYFYDETKGRYFKITKERPLKPTPKRVAEPTRVAAPITTRRRTGWMGYLAERELSGSFSRRLSLHQSSCVSRFVSARMTGRQLSMMQITLDTARDRINAMSIDHSGSSLVVGRGSGLVTSYDVSADEGFDRAQCYRRTGAIVFQSMTVSSIRHSKPGSTNVLVSAIGASVAPQLSSLLARGTDETTRGCVALFSDTSITSPSHTWRFTDPWVVEWSPIEATTFSVGRSGRHGASLVDINAASRSPDNGVSTAPSGRIYSDTRSQSFSPRSVAPIVLNGTRNGSFWLWDSRAPHRAMEVDPDSASKHASLTCLRTLSDERRVVMQSSNGQLSIRDLRSPTHASVTWLASGESKAYRPMQSFDMDETESVLAASSPRCNRWKAVALYDVHSGSELARLLPSDTESSDGTAIESVLLRESQRSRMTVWGLGRNALYRSASSDE